LTIRKQIRNTWKVLKCGAGEGWKILVGTIVGGIKNYRRVEEERNILRTVSIKIM
jgi:hypothetical protein